MERYILELYNRLFKNWYVILVGKAFYASFEENGYFNSFKVDIAKDAFCNLQISKTINMRNLWFVISEDIYVNCALGYIQSYMCQ